MLSGKHLAMLREESAIADAVIEARGYRTVEKKAELKALGFSPAQCRVPALVIPVYSVTGEVALHQSRPDAPRAGRDGKLIKYETPRGARMALDVHPCIRQHLGNPTRPLFITEGIRKADSAISHGLCCIALLGVWNWRGRNADGGKLALPDWEAIALRDREIYIIFDSDVMLKREVHDALARLKAFLEHRGARVRLIYLEPQTDGTKVGPDNFFAAGGTVTTLIAQATTELRRFPEEGRETASLGSYQVNAHGIFMRRAVGDHVIPVPLTNFSARIVADVEKDDGVETQRLFEIEARLGDKIARKSILAERFASLGWVPDLLGAQAIVFPGQYTREHARVAIQTLSQNVIEQHVYVHLGWRKIGERWCYLHAGGALGPDGRESGVEVAVPAALERYTLPDPPHGQELIDAIRASLRVLLVAPASITVPLYAALWRAILGGTDFSPHLTGPTGTGKTELAALIQQHHGSGLDARQLPASWSSTGNALEGLAFAAKDVVLTVDDFAPTGSTADVQRFHREADRLLRAQGNRSGRLRMRADATLKPAKPPRGLILSTGEDIPRGQSLRARLLVLEVSPGDVSWPVISECQRDAAAGVYAQALAGFVRWVAGQYEAITGRLRQEINELRNHAIQTGHKRTPDIVANLAIGVRYFLRFALEYGAISKAEQATRWNTAWVALTKAAAAQAQHQAASEVARRFIELLAASLASGRAHVAAPDGRYPLKLEAWGWRKKLVGTGEDEREEVQPQGARVGWVDGDALYLESDAAFAIAQGLAHAQGEALTVSAQTLRKRLKEGGYLATWDKARQTLTIRRVLEGKEISVLHLHKDVVLKGLSTPRKLDKPDIPPFSPPSGQKTSEDAAKKPDICQANPTNPTPRPTSESGAKSDGYTPNVGNVGLAAGGEAPCEQTAYEGALNGKAAVGNVGLAENQNPTPATENPTATDEAPKDHEDI